MVWIFLLSLLLTPITFSVLALSLLLKNGCLRVGLFLFGWVVLTPFAGALLTGLILVLAGMEGNLSAEIAPGIQFFLVAYPVVAVGLHQYFSRLPEEEVEAWRNTLKGGALLGFGVGTAGKAASSAAGGYGGFGGGSFGGGGAGGSFKGSAVASGGAASSAGGSASGAGAGAGAAASTTAAATSTAEDRAPAPDATSPDNPVRGPAPDRSSAESRGAPQTSGWGFWHVVGFLLVAVAFVPIGIGLTALFANPGVMAMGLVALSLYGAYRALAWAFPEQAASVSEWAAPWRPSRYWARVKRGEASAALPYLVAFFLGGPFGLVGLYLFLQMQAPDEDGGDTSFEGGTAASAWE